MSWTLRGVRRGSWGSNDVVAERDWKQTATRTTSLPWRSQKGSLLVGLEQTRSERGTAYAFVSGMVGTMPLRSPSIVLIVSHHARLKVQSSS